MRILLAFLSLVALHAQTTDSSGRTLARVPFASLAGLSVDVIYCTDCVMASPVTSGGSGGFVHRDNGVWNGGGGSGTGVTSPFSSVWSTLTYSAASGFPCLSGTITGAQVAALGAVTSGNIPLANVTEPFAMLVTYGYEGTIFTATGTLTVSYGTASTTAFYLPTFSLKQASPVVSFGASGIVSAASGTTSIIATFTGASNLSGVTGGPLTVKICGGSI